MWTLFEPVHAVTYFAPEALEVWKAAGVRGFWRGYFAGRAAPLGAAGPAVVTASFYNFAPAFVARALPSVWELIPPTDALRVRREGAVAAMGLSTKAMEKLDNHYSSLVAGQPARAGYPRIPV